MVLLLYYLICCLIEILNCSHISSLAEIEKLYHLALNGSEEEKSAAAKILCGASLRRGWNIQVARLFTILKIYKFRYL